MAFGSQPQEVFLLHRQTERGSREAGGILMGRLLSESEDVVVDYASQPNAQDRRSRFGFVRALLPAQNKVREAWQQSNGTSVYLGEWHSHPEDFPWPSWLDRREWRRIAATAIYSQSSLIFVIVGRLSNCAFEVNRLGDTRQLVLSSS